MHGTVCLAQSAGFHETYQRTAISIVCVDVWIHFTLFDPCLFVQELPPEIAARIAEAERIAAEAEAEAAAYAEHAATMQAEHDLQQQEEHLVKLWSL